MSNPKLEDLINLAKNTKSEPVLNAKGVIFDSGMVKLSDGSLIEGWKISEQIRLASNGFLSNTNDADASKLISNLEFRNAMNHAAIAEGKDINAILNGVINADGTRTPGLWDDVSRELARNASGDVYIVAPDADASRIFRQTELIELINNPKVNTIDTIPRATYKTMFDTAIASGKTSTQALDEIYKSVQATNKIQLSDIKQYTDIDGTTKYALPKEYLGTKSTIPPIDVPFGAKNIKSYVDTIEILSNDSLKALGKIAGTAGHAVNAVMTTLDLGIIIGSAKIKSDAGDYPGAAKALLEGLGGMTGGVALGGAGAVLGAAIVAKGGVVFFLPD